MADVGVVVGVGLVALALAVLLGEAIHRVMTR